MKKTVTAIAGIMLAAALVAGTTAPTMAFAAELASPRTEEASAVEHDGTTLADSILGAAIDVVQRTINEVRNVVDKYVDENVDDNSASAEDGKLGKIGGLGEDGKLEKLDADEVETIKEVMQRVKDALRNATDAFGEQLTTQE